jgi:hypothetical protein
MRVQHHRNRRVLLLGGMVTTFEAARGAGKNNFRHQNPLIDRLANQPPLCPLRLAVRRRSLGKEKGGGSGVVGLERTALGELEAAF